MMTLRIKLIVLSLQNMSPMYISSRLVCLVTSGNYDETYPSVMQLSVKKKTVLVQNTANDGKPYLNISKSKFRTPIAYIFRKI